MSNQKNKKEEDKNVLNLTPEQLAELINQAVEDKLKTIEPTEAPKENDITKVLSELTTQLRNDKNETKGTIKDYEIDTNDYLDEEVLFFTYSFSYGIYGDVRYGQQIETPYGKPIKFKPLYRYKKPSGGKHSDDVITTSVCKVRSKRERDFLTSHSLFGIKFFRTQSEVVDLDTAYADKLVEISYMLNSMSEHEIISRAKQERITIDTTNVDDIKKRLVHHLAEKEMKVKKKVGMPKPVTSDWSPENLDKVLDKKDY
jgi:hypothetical protein